MNDASVCAVIITFRPKKVVLENLAKVRTQVQGLVVVDNGSPAESLTPFRAVTSQLGFSLIENGGNLGIAAALNIGVRWAKSQGFQHVILFDQDSTVTEGFVGAMLNEYMLHAQRDMVAIVTQRQVEQGTGRDRTLRCAQDGGPVDAITSGSLMPIAIFDQCGWFDEQLIIDGVDYEYCLRARSLGYTLVKCWRAVLLVSVGSVRRHQILGWKVNASHHSTARRYYMTRNKLVVVHRFWRRNPAWCYRAIRDMAKDTIKIVLFEDERWRKLRNTARGIIDALNGRMGKVVEL